MRPGPEYIQVAYTTHRLSATHPHQHLSPPHASDMRYIFYSCGKRHHQITQNTGCISTTECG
jgi:hypothetical protein